MLRCMIILWTGQQTSDPDSSVCYLTVNRKGGDKAGPEALFFFSLGAIATRQSMHQMRSRDLKSHPTIPLCPPAPPPPGAGHRGPPGGPWEKKDQEGVQQSGIGDEAACDLPGGKGRENLEDSLLMDERPLSLLSCSLSPSGYCCKHCLSHHLLTRVI